MIFLGDIAFYIATLVFAAGIYLLHHAKHHDHGKECRLLKFGSYFVLTVSILGMLCTGFYWMKYWNHGAYSMKHSTNQPMMRKGMGMNMMGGSNMMSGMGEGMMQTMQHCMGQMDGKMMNQDMMGKMQGCMMKGMENMPSNTESTKDMSEEEHESHH